MPADRPVFCACLVRFFGDTLREPDCINHDFPSVSRHIIADRAGIKPGKYEQPASPADVAPTLAALSGTALPNAEGRVLKEALR